MIIRRIITAVLTVFWGLGVCVAQQIVVVSESGKTKVFNRLQDAIEKATNGSTIYLPNGSFRINDETVISQKVCFVGIGHKAKSLNADGNTTIVGNLCFDEKSDGSSVMGCYITGNVIIGNEESSVNDVVVKCCNVNSIQVKNNACVGTIICQNYIRNGSNLARGSFFENNIAKTVNCECGKIVNNLFINSSGFNTCYVARNIFLNGQGIDGNNISLYNVAKGDVGNFPVNIGENEWSDLFVKYNNGSISTASDFHFKDEYKTLYKDYGIYGGSGFNDSGQPPLPFFEAKSIPEQTDAEGNLTIHIRVNNGEKKAE